MQQCRSKSFFSSAAVLHHLPDLYQVLLSCKRWHHEPYGNLQALPRMCWAAICPTARLMPLSLSCMQDYNALHPYILLMDFTSKLGNTREV